ncbi:hypothetical protein [Mesorhizobium sp. NZP2077]|uniref:DUF7662 domain-containing protein n=1 Tax=Mesorhizobium sp. NZP2077 TaxID=2483404 RepID=UPI001552FA94|nr:hypothetical protein [Mesorhizobium sp. NZP2077]QKC81249.1 hypothetical protein EB232_05975 [Mesorhizobium sp. NZP2077]QKD14680.1 hypothetical protein HGP13_05865 [Mesorhizobium sp. NZP2077]
MTKYAPIADFLQMQALDELSLDFEKIEEILGASLPRSAYDHQAWWANDVSHSQGRSWLDAGWKTENLDLVRRSVTFARVSESTQIVPITPPTAPLSLDPWGALAGTVTIHDENALTSPVGEMWDAEAGDA